MDNPHIDDHGDQTWRDDFGRLHRDSGPAIIFKSGTRLWYQHGRAHRIDGPARIWADGRVQWCLDGYIYTFEEWLKEVAVSYETKIMLKLQYG